MNLRELREQFILKSGRYDLVGEDFSDSGADFFIRAGQRYLDLQGDFGTGLFSTWRGVVNKGASQFLVPDCWAVQRVFGRPTSGSEENWDEWVFVNSFTTPKCAFSSEQLYTILPIREYPNLHKANADEVVLPASSLDISALPSYEDVTDVRVKLLPALKQDTIIRVVGNFFSSPLLVDESSNYWSTRWPEILLKAAMYELEVFYRNSEGAKDWMGALQSDLSNLAQSELFASIQGDLVMGE